MQKERLLMLADKLDTVEYFDMGSWFYKDTCGTASCAMGHATTIPEFQELGLTAIKVGNTYVPYFPGENHRFGGNSCFGAAERLFEIDFNCATYLFSPEAYRGKVASANVVARRIRDVVENGYRVAFESRGT